ncbi:ribosomal protein S18-alanine N-acetyltransferase [Nitratireductor rhodophyticola]|uniref:ribosomal protein S18-alanine N-acetyltransferase n=1 Tax=Nitratireductor rhodophyticola TaxID=2854036 RepID=UPI002AC937FA|nr:ribosomal protein S18-alanine N-acetyltransferase [Nitratireductor rhodophyticola]WPZ14061.1 ribosomal protein S18-alanine N-acetyltransferase [Nitratireductor rhodophyticola]
MPIDVRHADLADLDALVAIENAAFSGDRLSQRSLRRLIGSRAAITCVAEEGEKILGYALALTRRTSGIARLYSIAVAPDETGRGVAALLLHNVENAACARGFRTMRLEVRADNEPAIRLYEKTGYRSFAQYENYYHDGMSALRYQKALCALSTENGPR